MNNKDKHLFLHRGPRGSFAALRAMREMSSSDYPELKWEVPELDRYIVSGAPGRLYTVVGRPGNGKTSVLLHLSHTFARAAALVGGVVLYASWEVLVEEFYIARGAAASGVTLFDAGKKRLSSRELDSLEGALVRESREPFIMFGRSQLTPTAAIPTVTDLYGAMDVLKKDGIKVSAVLVDYLQRMPHPTRRTSERRDAVAENVQRLKDMATIFTVPVYLAAQGARTIDAKKGLRHADLSEIQWSSDAEQTSDTVISVTYPKTYMLGKELEFEGSTVMVTDQMFSLRVLKQRYGPAGRTFITGLDAPTGRLYPMNLPGRVY